MGGYGKVADKPADAVESIGRVQVFHSVVNGDTAERTGDELAKLMQDTNHPRFFNIFLMNWSFKAPDIERLAARCKGLGITLVAPENLDRLSRQSAAKVNLTR